MDPFRGSSSGLARTQLEHHRHLLRDVYVDPAAEEGFELDCRAAVAAVPDARLDRWTAARLWRLPMPVEVGAISFTRPAEASVSEHDTLLTRRARLHPDDVDECRGHPVTSLARTFVDLGASSALHELVAVGDVVCRRVGLEPMHAAIGRSARRKGIVLAREAVLLVDPRSGSAGETRARLLLHAAGFLDLEHAVVLRDVHGGWIGEADLADEQARVCVQYDGDTHFADDPQGLQRRQDVARDELARLAGWEVVVLLASDLADPPRAVAKVQAAYDRAHDRRRGRLLAS